MRELLHLGIKPPKVCFFFFFLNLVSYMSAMTLPLWSRFPVQCGGRVFGVIEISKNGCEGYYGGE